jgi:hypothetical protein
MAQVKRSRVRIAGLASLAAGALVAGLAGCGGSQFTYVRDNEGETYFKVPASWSKVDHKPIQQILYGEDPDSESARMRAQFVWTAAFDGDAASPGAQHFIPLGVKAEEPFVYSVVQPLTEEQRDTMSLNTLRNWVWPVTKSLRDQIAQSNPEFPLQNFELLADEVLEPGDGASGVHVRFNYQLGAKGETHTFDLTGYLNAANTKVSILLVRCSATCYRQRAAELDGITKSFKIRKMLG